MIGIFSVMYGNSVFSSVFAVDNRRDIGRQFVPMLWSLFGFEMG